MAEVANIIANTKHARLYVWMYISTNQLSLSGKPIIQQAVYEGGEVPALLLILKTPANSPFDGFSGTRLSRDDGLRAHDPRKRFLHWLRNGKRIRPGNAARGFAVAWRAFLEGRELQLIRIVDQSKPVEIEGVPLAQEVEAAAGLRGLPTEETASDSAQPRGGHARGESPAQNYQQLEL